jgi:hypothetical protein
MWPCDSKHSNTHVMTILICLFEIFHKCEKKYEKGIFWSFFLKEKRSLDLQKNENHVGTFSYWFWFGNNLYNV